MAHSAAKFLSFLLMLLAIFSVQIHARESQFFSKVPSTNANNNVQETTVVVPSKEQRQELTSVPESQKTATFNYEGKQQERLNKEQDPAFIPETQNGYGLYGHESGQFPPTVSTAQTNVPDTTPTTNTENYQPYTTPTTTPTTNTENYQPYTTPTTTNTEYYQRYTTPTTPTIGNNYESYTTPTTTTDMYTPYTTTETQESNEYSPTNNNNNNNYNNRNAFYSHPENTGKSKYQGNGYTSLAANEQNSNYYTANNNYNDGNNVYKGEKQGMSDTRFMANGKYFYDVPPAPKNYYSNQFQNSREKIAGNENNNNRFFNGDNESYENNNRFEGYQNQENEFDELQD